MRISQNLLELRIIGKSYSDLIIIDLNQRKLIRINKTRIKRRPTAKGMGGRFEDNDENGNKDNDSNNQNKNNDIVDNNNNHHIATTTTTTYCNNNYHHLNNDSNNNTCFVSCCSHNSYKTKNFSLRIVFSWKPVAASFTCVRVNMRLRIKATRKTNWKQ